MKRAIKLTLLFCIYFITISATAQNKPSITGKIKDGDNQSVIDAASVSLVKVADTSLVKTAITDKTGNFQFENVKGGTYMVIATSVGHKRTFSQPITVDRQPTTDIGTLQLVPDTKTLSEVKVVAKKPLIERKLDRTVMNVDASINNTGSTALELLETAPGVSVDKDGNVSLRGKDGVVIMIDGKPTYMTGQNLTNLLKSMPSSALEQIEIMTNPSAKYDASGNSGIINIKTKKNKLKGFNGTVTGNFGGWHGWRSSNSLNLNYRNNKVNLFGNYSFFSKHGYQELDINRKFRNSSKEVETIFDQYSIMQNTTDEHTIKIGMDYYASKKTTLGLVASSIINPSKNWGDNTTYLENGVGHIDSTNLSTNLQNDKMNNLGLNFNLRHTFDSTGKEITADLDYISYVQGADQLFVNDYYNPDGTIRKAENQLKGNLPSDIRIYSAKMDYSVPMKKNAKLEMGAKSSYVTTDNNAIYQTNISGAWAQDNGKTNHFLYNENINAGYINYNKQIKKWSFQAGLRVENTIAKGHQLGNSGGNNDSSFTQNYTDLFPTAFVSYEANKKNTYSFSYGRRIDRPSYQDLNPFYYFLDDYTYQVGNTNLRPQYTNSFELAHTYKGFLTTTLNYSKTKDMMAETFDQITAERKTFVSKGNIASRSDVSLSISAGLPITKFWSSNIYVSLNDTKYSGALYGSTLDVTSTIFMANISNQFKFNKGWSAELSGFYRTKGVEGELLMQPMGQISAGVQKMVLKNKGTVKFNMRDIFNTQIFHGNIQYKDIDATFMNDNSRRVASVSFTYRFGKPFKAPQKRKTGGADEELNRVKTNGGN